MKQIYEPKYKQTGNKASNPHLPKLMAILKDYFYKTFTKIRMTQLFDIVMGKSICIHIIYYEFLKRYIFFLIGYPGSQPAVDELIITYSKADLSTEELNLSLQRLEHSYSYHSMRNMRGHVILGIYTKFKQILNQIDSSGKLYGEVNKLLQ